MSRHTRSVDDDRYDRYMQHNEQSTVHKLKETYWTTKQYVKKKLGKKEDEHVVASDAQLDSKLEVFVAIQKSCMDLLRAIEKYQDRLCALSQEENTMGRFLKNESQRDKTRAGKMMAAVGKTQSHASQQRLALRVPLVRLYQEVETFRYRAISDTLMTIHKMEAARTEYRGALLWMKDISEELDPDTYKQLEKFRKVQAQVKKTKARFDKLKLDTMQKIDLLAASRCNMFSHVLVTYQQNLLQFWNKTSRTHSAVAESFKGYQYYEFNMLKELAEPSKELAKQTGQKDVAERDIDGLIGFDISQREYRDEDTDADKGSMNNLYQASDSQDEREKNGDNLLEFEEEEQSIEEIKRKQDEEFGEFLRNHGQDKKEKKDKVSGPQDLLTDAFEPDETDKDDLTLLNEILNAPPANDDFSKEWCAVFGDTPLNPTANYPTPAEPEKPKEPAQFMPSSLLDLGQQMSAMNLGQGQMVPQGTMGMPMQQPMSMHPGMVAGGPMPTNPTVPSNQPSQPPKQVPQPKSKKQKASNMAAWFNLFADLDPLSNPDAIGKEQQDVNAAL